MPVDPRRVDSTGCRTRSELEAIRLDEYNSIVTQIRVISVKVLKNTRSDFPPSNCLVRQRIPFEGVTPRDDANRYHRM